MSLNKAIQRKETNDSHNTCYQNVIRYEKENAFIKNCLCALFSFVFVIQLRGGMTGIFSVGLQKTDKGPEGLTEFITIEIYHPPEKQSTETYSDPVVSLRWGMKHFQASFRVITLGSNQIENHQIEKSSTEKLTAWLLSKLHVIRQLKYRLKLITQTERFRESNCKHCKTTMLAEINVSGFFGFPPWEFGGKHYYFAC